MDKVIRIKEVLPLDLFHRLQDDLQYWELSNYSYGDSPGFLGRKNPDELIFKEAQTIVKLKIQKYIPYHLKPVRVHLNAAFSNQKASIFHTDFDVNGMITFVLYTALHWNTQWGGETVIFTPENEYEYVPYMPNNGCFFPSHWEHFGASPNSHTECMRTSVAFGYKICYNHPIKPNKL